MPADEGEALYEAALAVAVDGPLLEVGSYCGKSAVYLGAAARERGRVLFSVDHHRGSEENQAGLGVARARPGRPGGRQDGHAAGFRRTVHDAGLEGTVVAVVGDSPAVAGHWTHAAGAAVHRRRPRRRAGPADYEGWTPHVAPGGTLVIHDVFPDPADGGRPPVRDLPAGPRAAGSPKVGPSARCGSSNAWVDPRQ